MKIFSITQGYRNDPETGLKWYQFFRPYEVPEVLGRRLVAEGWADEGWPEKYNNMEVA